MAALLLSKAAVQAAQPAPAMAGQHAITGTWAWTLPGTSCTETWQYRADGIRTSSSGAEMLQSRYQIAAVPSLLGFYRLQETVTETNAKPDCAGDLHEVSDQPDVRFIQFSPQRDRFIVCKEESLQACFGPLVRREK